MIAALRLPAFLRHALMCCGMLAALFVSVGLAPEPDPVPRRWELSIEPGPLRVTSVETPSGTRSYFYLTYKVTNSYSSDLTLAPSFDLSIGEGNTYRSGRDVPPDVTRQILESLQNPLLQDQISVVGTILRGEENAREGLVIWPAPSLRASEVTIYAAGFSGETRSERVRDPKTGDTKPVLLRKTLMLRYQTPGEIQNWAAKPFDLLERRWIMR
ncbi:MAG: hypothetical protein KF859_09185 [Phycisphaeraceae bacterium]|nr:hypothetical protein [Phycisphaeraceae bacterium]